MTDRITQLPAPPEARDDPAHTIEALNDQLQDQAIELDMLREALGVPYEPHQSLLERMLEAARGRAGSGAAPEPPAQEPTMPDRYRQALEGLRERCAQEAERITARRRAVAAMSNNEAVKPCEVAAAIRKIDVQQYCECAANAALADGEASNG